jgi:5-methylthioadenosine/S-adenosylhomocysteine deaminase
MDLVLTGGTVLTMDDRKTVLDPGAVGIVGDRIAAVGSPDEFAGVLTGRTLDCRGSVVIPGLVDCHTHLFQSLARGRGDGLALWPWLQGLMWPYGAAMHRAEAEVAATLGAALAVRSGTTALLDHHNSPNDLESTIAVAAAVEAVGMRGVVARTIRGPRPPLADAVNLPSGLGRSFEEEIEIAVACLGARRPEAMVTIWPAPANPVHVEQRMFVRAVELAREYRTGWHTHCSEASTDPEMFVEAYGVRPVEWLAKEGMLGPDATLAHAIWLDNGEVELIGETRSGVSHNPASNAYLGAGVMRLRELRQAGASVGLGTDGLAVAGPNVLRCMEHAVLQQRQRTLDPASSQAEEALELATRGGAGYLRIDAGVVAPGRLADLAVIDVNRLHVRPVTDPTWAVVYAAEPSDVTMTIVGGRIVYEGGRCIFVDEEALMAEVDERVKTLADRAGLAPMLVRGRADG